MFQLFLNLNSLKPVCLATEYSLEPAGLYKILSLSWLSCQYIYFSIDNSNPFNYFLFNVVDP